EYPGSFTLARTGPVSDALSVLAQVTVVANAAPPQTTVFGAFFAPGEQTVEMPLVVPSTHDDATMYIVIVTNPAYDVGEPSTAHLVVTIARVGCPTTTTSENTSTTTPTTVASVVSIDRK